MPIIGNTEIRFHRTDWMKPIFPKKKDKNPPADIGAPTEAPTEAGTRSAEQQARTWRHRLFNMIATAPVVRNAELTEVVEEPDPVLVVPTVVTNATAPAEKFTPTLDRLRAGLDLMVVQQMYEETIVRITELFDSPELAERRRESEAAIDYYISHNNFKQGKIPAKVRQLLIIADMAIRDIHRAFPYGRGNVLVRDVDSLGGVVGKNPNDFNLPESSMKYGLYRLGRADVPPTQFPPDSSDYMMHWTASQLMVGATSCAGYTYALSPALMARLAQMQLSEGETLQLRMFEWNDDQIRLGGIGIDHSICELVFTDEDGEEFKIVLDPWADMNTPLLKEHFKYDYDHVTPLWEFDDCTLPYKEMMLRSLDESLLDWQAILDGPGLQDLPVGDKAIREADPAKTYPMTNTQDGFVTRETLNAAKDEDEVKLPLREGTTSVTRRPSFSSAGRSPVYRNQTT